MNLESAIYFNANKMCEYYFYNYYKYPFAKRYPSFKEKYFQYFKKAVMSFINRDEFDPQKFVFSIMMEEKQMPQQLYKESNWKIFLRNKDFFEENKPKKDIENKNKELIDAINSIKDGMSFLKNKKIEEIFNSPLDRIPFEKDTPPCDLLLFYFSKFYNNWYFENNPDSDGLFMEGAKKTVKKYPLLVEKIKEYLKEDYID